MFRHGFSKRFPALFLTLGLLVSLMASFTTPLTAGATGTYSDLADSAVQFNKQAYTTGTPLDAYDAYVLTLAGEDLSSSTTDWVYNGKTLKQSILDAVDATLQDSSSKPSKYIANELLAVKGWGDNDRASQLAKILAGRQGPQGFDNNVYSDIPAFAALGLAGEFSVVNAVYAREYLLGSQCTDNGDNFGAWGGTFDDTFYPDFMTTCQAIRALTYLPGAASDQQVQTAINNGLAYLQQWQQDDGSVYTGWDDPLVDTAEVIITLKRLGLDPAGWKKAEGLSSPLDYIKDKALNDDGSFGSTRNVLDATEALYAYLVLDGRTGTPASPELKLIPATASVAVNSQQQYQAVVNYFDGTSSDVTNDAAWSVGDTGIASVSDSVYGLITARSAGQTVITATYGGLTATASLTVTAPAAPPGQEHHNTCTVDMAVVGMNGELLYGPGSVTVSEDGKWGLTALGALDATGLSYGDDNGFVKSIAGQANSGMNGWMYKVNGMVPMVGAAQQAVQEGNQVIWWYSTDINSPGPSWESLQEGYAGNAPVPPAVTTPADLKEQNKKLPVTLQVSDVALDALEKIAPLLDLKENTDEVGPLNEVKKAVAVVGSDQPLSREVMAALRKELEQNKIDLAQKVTSAAGATITDNKEEIALAIPGGALTQDVEITVKKNDFAGSPGNGGGNNAPAAPPAGYRPVSAAYHFGPDGTTFAVPVTITLKVALPPLAQPENLALAWYDQAKDEWVAIPAVFDVSKGLILARVNHFSDYAVFVREIRKSFVDVTPASYDWAQAAIEELAGAGIVAGVDGSHFEPGRAVTRAEFASLLVKALGLETKQGAKIPFKDVKDGAWYAGAVTTAAVNGLVKGYEDGSFRPEKTITREEVAAMLVRAMNLPATEEQLPFKDSDSVSAWARNSVAVAAAHGLVKGFADGSFRPGADASRAECAVMVYRMLVAE